MSANEVLPGERLDGKPMKSEKVYVELSGREIVEGLA
jgi:hypothetical protein